MSRVWEMLRRREMKSLKFMGKEGAMDLTAHRQTHRYTHTHPIAIATATIEPKLLCGLTPFLTEWKSGLLLLSLLIVVTVVMN